MRKPEVTTALAMVSPTAIAELYERTVGDVYSYLASRVGDRGVAEQPTTT